MTPELKRCIKCLNEKPLSDFYIVKAMADGHCSKCRTCCNAYDVVRRARRHNPHVAPRTCHHRGKYDNAAIARWNLQAARLRREYDQRSPISCSLRPDTIEHRPIRHTLAKRGCE